MKGNLVRSGKEGGQSFVELAVSLIMLLMLLMGILDFGRAFFTFIALRDAAQEGAIYGSTNPDDLSGIDSRVRHTSSTPVDMTDNTVINVDVNIGGTSCAGNTIGVAVSYPEFPLLTPFMARILGSDTIRISAVVSDTILLPPCK